MAEKSIIKILPGREMENEAKSNFVSKHWIYLIIFGVLVMGALFVIIFSTKDEEDSSKKEAGLTVAVLEDEFDCPNTLTFNEGGATIAVFNGVEKEVTAEEISTIHNKCPDVAISGSSATQAQSSPQIVNESGSQTSNQNSTKGQTSTLPASSNDETNKNSNQDKTEQSNQLPPLAYGSVTTPFFAESDIISANEAYSMDPNNPYWGFAHPGVDFMADHTIRVQAAISGTIGNLTVAKDPGLMGWHAGFCIDTGTQYSICYNLETFSKDEAVGTQLQNGLKIQTGTQVNQGDHIADLVFGGSGAHIDFGIAGNGTRVCPEPYFTESARAMVLRIIHILQPSWPMCF